MSQWCRVVRVLLLASIYGSFISAADSPKRPNVLLMITDDQGYGDLSIHGNTMIQTPQIDALARQSVRLTNFHVDPTCSETRSALMTGRYSCRAGVWHTVMGRSILGRTEYTMAQEFAAHGYRTAMFGKWHLGDNFPYRPHDRGFQECLYHGGGGVGQTPDFWGNDYFDDTYFRNDGRPEPQQGYCTDVWFREATRFIEGNRDRPFFCYLATNAPHAPYNVDPKYSQPYVERGVPQPMANFYGMIANVDENVGRLLKKLEEWKLADNTILVFMTDNGSAAGTPPGNPNAGKKKRQEGSWPGFAAGMRGQKGSQYEGGHRVPCFIRWPAGRLQVDRDMNSLAAHFDLLPTFMALCNMNPPADVHFDGTSLAGELRGDQDGSVVGRTLVVHSQRVDQPEKWRKCSVMTQRWRLVDGKELYDLPADPGQTSDVAAEHLDVVAKLRTFYENWWKDVSSGVMSQGFDKYASILLGAKEANPTSLNCMDWHTELAQIPWSQSNIAGNPDAEANGFWAVEVAQPGKYEFILRSRPAGVPYAMKSGTARLKIGSVEASTEIAAESDGAKIVVALSQGPARLQTWLKEDGRNERGAFFVDVRRVD